MQRCELVSIIPFLLVNLCLLTKYHKGLYIVSMGHLNREHWYNIRRCW